MTNYRAISQEYAKEAIKAAMLINAGAAVALLTQVTALMDRGLADAASSAMIWWASGLLVAALTWLMAFLSTRYVDKAEDEQHLQHLTTSNYFMFAGMAAIVLSLVLFAVGCIALACGFSGSTSAP